jgi:hypothetical protein
VTQKTFNFYTFKQSENDTFLCQNSSLKFLSENNMDFKKIFLKGLNFINEDEEDVINKIKESEKANQKKSIDLSTIKDPKSLELITENL